MGDRAGGATLAFGERVAELAGLPHRPGTPRSPRVQRTVPPEECDVLVVGSGGAGLSAAAGALSTGASVVICEKGPVPGGTTACSGGVAHVYANAVMRAAGVEDPRPEALAYMARVGYPGAYDPEAPFLGVPREDFALLEAYYDRGAEVMDKLARIGAVRMEAPWMAWDGQMFPDYFEFPENQAVRGRGIQPALPEGRASHDGGVNGAGNGGELVRQLAEFAAARGTRIRLCHRVVDLLSEGPAVTGAIVDDGSTSRTILTRGGVIFGSGGFAHDPQLRERFLRGPIAGSSGTPSNTGDLLAMATRAGAQFGRMHSGWWNQQVLEALDDYATTVLDIWAVPGDGMVLVNRLGVRAVDEKREYESRGRVHHVYEGDEYVNRVMFMVYDRRTAERFGGRYPIPPPGAMADHVISGTGVAGLTKALGERLAHRARAGMPTGIAPVALDPGFEGALAATLNKFNAMAERGRDDDFGRGSKAVEFAFHGPAASDNRLPNPLMYPLDTGDELYAVAVVGATFDTNSGPRTTAEGRVLGGAGPIDGLYGAGNCVDSVFGEGYPGGGATIGPGMVFGFQAGAHAGQRAANRARR